MSPKVDAFLKRQDKWRPEFKKLREIPLGSGLTEDLKWGPACHFVYRLIRDSEGDFARARS